MIATLLEFVGDNATEAAYQLRQSKLRRLEDAKDRAVGKWTPDARDMVLTYVLDAVAGCMSQPTKEIIRAGIFEAARKRHREDHPPEPAPKLGFTWGRTDNDTGTLEGDL